MRGVAREDRPLEKRFQHEPDAALGEIAGPAVHEFRGPARHALGEVLNLENRAGESTRRGVDRHAQPRRAAANHHRVEGLRPLGHVMENRSAADVLFPGRTMALPTLLEILLVESPGA